MFGTLIESRSLPQRRTGSSLASVIIHSALVGGAVLATARETITASVAPTTATPVVFEVERPKPNEPAPVSRPMTAPTTAAAPRALVLETPTIVPTDIPPIDLTVAPTPADFSARRVASTGVLCDRDCPSVARSAGPTDRDTWNANDVMMRLRDDPVPPRYPESLRRAGVEGTVLVKFVVDTTGRVDMASIEVVRSTHEAFTTAVREALARLRFNPSMSGHRKVPALAMMPFQFTLR